MASVAVALKSALAYLHANIHLWLLDVVLLLPGLDSTFADVIREYIHKRRVAAHSKATSISGVVTATHVGLGVPRVAGSFLSPALSPRSLGNRLDALQALRADVQNRWGSDSTLVSVDSISEPTLANEISLYDGWRKAVNALPKDYDVSASARGCNISPGLQNGQTGSVLNALALIHPSGLLPSKEVSHGFAAEGNDEGLDRDPAHLDLIRPADEDVVARGWYRAESPQSSCMSLTDPYSGEMQTGVLRSSSSSAVLGASDIDNLGPSGQHDRQLVKHVQVSPQCFYPPPPSSASSSSSESSEGEGDSGSASNALVRRSNSSPYVQPAGGFEAQRIVINPSPRGISRDPTLYTLQSPCQTYTIHSKIGGGFAGEVFFAYCSADSWFAIKVVSKFRQYLLAEGRKTVINEGVNWQTITDSGRPFLTPLFESFDDADRIYFVMPLHFMTLTARLGVAQPRISPQQMKLYIAELVSAVDGLHALGIMHRDIKPGNILIDTEGHLSLADFGLAYKPVEARQRMKFCQRRSWQKSGTPGYWAPEVRKFDQKKGFTCSADIYSLGVVILELVLGTPWPFFTGTTTEEINYSMERKPIPFHLIEDKNLRNLLEQMLQTDPKARPSTTDLKQHAYFADFSFDELENKFYQHDYVPAGVDLLIPLADRDLNDYSFRPPTLADFPMDQGCYDAPEEFSVDYYTRVRAQDVEERPFDWVCSSYHANLARG